MPVSKVIKLPLEKNSQSPEPVVERSLNLPNVLTVLRILMVPIYVILFLNPTPIRSIAAASVFSLAALTDLLDGYLARRRGQVTKVGRLLDPIADKFLVISGLILLVQFQRIDAWLAIAFIVRELGITGVRAVAASKGLIIAAGQLGKYKVVLQLVGIIFLTLQGALVISFLDFYLLGTGLLYGALVFSIISAGQYLWEFWQALVNKDFIE
ncbi:CDP-diacylglycerol--glycerol-3-phosphate 3-phosphatidyltransferase [Candidatus Nitronereus thalassa]|uniref:CDP-diacylglycerol--glycerol-3-phosphate 3-phosphatidyltransferase n=1 Tax=Candidatus Nitronereus thalassa TaxID=3020898 RepID=A0ABU3K430_9BACT|nr:CDP-diacylglycerol--glycerol-3-phosphate 3-phosphatidyltransferase [Candidatus Nitronereus thalassa]MDT7041137.1 CDP-diacylglycerol--glycerol-3-phosphate 3-phosphatidyltransferase [Candidatus Nitronereus thalassa]